MNKTAYIFYLLVILFAIALMWCDDDSGPMTNPNQTPTVSPSEAPTPSPTPTPDTTPPQNTNNNTDTGTALLINGTSPITLNFDEEMDPLTLSIDGTSSGTLGAIQSSSGFDWNANNDQVIIQPDSEWNEGDGLTIVITGSDAAGNPMESAVTLYYNVDKTSPGVLSIVPSDRSTITDSENLVITFDETMDISFISLGGTLASDSDNGTWSTTTETNDTLTLSPDSAWTHGTQTITISCSDLADNPVSIISLTYGIQVMYVSQGSSGVGSMDDPMGNINDAIVDVDTNWGDGEVNVAQGTYNVDFDSSTQIVMMEGICLYGGFSSSDWLDRDSDTYITTISDVSSTGGTDTDPSRVIQCGPGITTATLLDGFTINGGDSNSGNYSAAVVNYEGGSPTISNNTINGGEVNDSYSICIANVGQSGPIITTAPVIQDNTLNGGGSIALGTTICIFNHDHGSPTITNNTISGGAGTQTIGISNTELSSPTISNNTITGGSGTSSAIGISNNNSTPDISDNVLISGGSGQASSTAINNTNCSAFTINNNTIDGAGASGGACGIINSNSSPTITNNTIDGGNDSNDNTFGIFNDSASNSSIVGNTIYGGDGSSSAYGIRNDNNSSPTLTNNSIEACGSSSDICYGIANDNISSGTIERNTINGGTTSNNVMFGIQLTTNASPVIKNNIIQLGSSNQTLGINMGGSCVPTISNNTIYSGTGTTVNVGINIQNSTPSIENNIIFNLDVSGYGITEANGTSDPSVCDNNNIFGFSSALYYNEGTTFITTIANLNAITEANNNISEDISTDLDSEYRFTGDLGSVIFDTSGKTLGSVTKDRDDVDRTAPYSIGAYEYD